MNYTQEQIKEMSLRVLAATVFIAVLFFGLWGSVQLVKLVPSGFSKLSNIAAVTTFTSIFKPKEVITIDISNSIASSDEELRLSWEHKGKQENSSYTFGYACKDGLTFQTTNNKGELETIECNSPFPFISDDNSILLTPISNEIRFVDVPVIITSVDEYGESTTLDDSLLTITNEDVSGSSLTPSNSIVEETTSTTEPALTEGERVDEIFTISDSRHLSDTSGRVDLEVRIIDTGMIDSSNVFNPTSTISKLGQGAIRFSVTNIGSKTSDNWTFNAVLPTYPMHIFHSTNQRRLAPGDRIDFTLGFDQLNPELTEGVITINVDPSGSIHNEVSRENNIAQATIQIVE